MLGSGKANISFQGKEILSVQINGGGTPEARLHLLWLEHTLHVHHLKVLLLCTGKVSDSVARLRTEVMTKLNAYMASNSLTANGEGVCCNCPAWVHAVRQVHIDFNGMHACKHSHCVCMMCACRPQSTGGGGVR